MSKVWCTTCGKRFELKEVEGVKGCPACKSVTQPCSSDQDVRVEVNWHELHVLCVWAENWARNALHDEDVVLVAAIAKRLMAQYPSFVPLTVAEETARLPQVQGARMEVYGAPKVPEVPVNGPGAVGHVLKP